MRYSRRTAGMFIATSVFACAVALTASAPSGRSSPAVPGLTRLVVPPDGKVYFGLTFRPWDTTDPAWGDTRPYEERIRDAITNELAGKTPTFLNVWAGWQASDQPGQPMVPFHGFPYENAVKERAVTGPASLLYLDWTLTNPGSDLPSYSGITTKDVASGRLDGYISDYARELKAFGKPVLTRLMGGEFNGSWWYSQSPYANKSLTTADFVAAWRRIVDIFRREGALNVSFAWIPSVVPAASDLAKSPGWIDPDTDAYYPGDDYVDWVGADIYSWLPPTALDALYGFGVSHDKPFFLAEWGVRCHSQIFHGDSQTPAQELAWINGMFDYIAGHPKIKAIDFFDYKVWSDPDAAHLAHHVYLYGGSVNYHPYDPHVDDCDSRLLADSGASWRAAFSARIADPRYISATLSEPVGQQLVPAVASLSVTVRGTAATVRWRGNATASTYDVAVRRPSSTWHTARSRSAGTTYRVRGRSGQRFQVRVRARDSAGAPGPWSRTATFTLLR